MITSNTKTNRKKQSPTQADPGQPVSAHKAKSITPVPLLPISPVQTFFALLGAFALLQAAGCAVGPPEFRRRDLSRFKPISIGVRHASSLVLYEGLPHRVWEWDQFEVELATKKIVRVHDFPFYERPLAVAANDVERLRRLSAGGGSFWSYGGEKSCGGFHPDYCLAWKDGGATYELLICLHCHEMRFYGPKQMLFADIRDEAFTQFETLLKNYRDQRPKQFAAPKATNGYE